MSQTVESVECYAVSVKSQLPVAVYKFFANIHWYDWKHAHISCFLSQLWGLIERSSSSSASWQSSNDPAPVCSVLPSPSPAAILPELWALTPLSCFHLAVVPAGISAWNTLFFPFQLFPHPLADLPFCRLAFKACDPFSYLLLVAPISLL